MKNIRLVHKRKQPSILCKIVNEQYIVVKSIHRGCWSRTPYITMNQFQWLGSNSFRYFKRMFTSFTISTTLTKWKFSTRAFKRKTWSREDLVKNWRRWMAKTLMPDISRECLTKENSRTLREKAMKWIKTIVSGSAKKESSLTDPV